MIKYIIQSDIVKLKFDLKFWIINISFWTIPALLSTTITYFSTIQTGGDGNWFMNFLGQSPNWYTWALLTPVVISLAMKFFITKSNKWKYVPIHFLCSLIVAGMHISLLLLSYVLLGMELFGSRFFTSLKFLLQYSTQLNIVIYFSILGVYYMISYLLRHRENEIQIAQLETKLALGHLHSLKEQIHPHFLFNTLNMLNSLIRTDSRENAVQVVSDLSYLLRASFETAQQQFHTVEEELEFISKYLKLIEYRFSDKLELTLNVSEEMYPAQVPTLLLQPIIENALKHGVEKLIGSGKISVDIFKENDNINFTISNTVSDVIAKSFNPKKLGGGFAITVERLKLLYKDKATINLFLSQPNIVCCQIEIPYVLETDID